MLLLVNVEKPKWVKHADGAARRQLQAGRPLPADVLMDSARLLRTNDNVISAWCVADDASNVERIVAAILLAHPKESIKHQGYILFDSEVPDGLGIGIIDVPGQTPDVEARRWHRDLGQLSAVKYVEFLGELIRTVDAEMALEQDLLRIVKEGLLAGRYETIPPQIAKQIRT